jgi:5-methylcytosine-specific restriction endonuclease McrA
MAEDRMPRTLRSKRQRALLWFAAQGKCQLCGADLDAHWESDHPIPWRLTHRTNLHEQAAVCRPCNRKKGGKVIDSTKGC